VAQSVVDRAFFGLALVLVEIFLELLLGFVEINQKFLPRAEGEAADVAIGQTWGAADEPDELESALRHPVIMAGRQEGVKSSYLRESYMKFRFWPEQAILERAA